MVDLYDAASNRLVGEISDDELQFLADALEEESTEDRDYYIESGTIEMLEGQGASGHLLDTLRRAVGLHEGVELRWQRR